MYNGRTCERLYSGYTTDGGHLSDAGNAGRDLVAKGFDALAATPPGNTHSVTNTGGVGQRFYRVSVRQ